MTDLWLALSVFHFLRPSWLLLVPVLLALWWLSRRRHRGKATGTEGIAPHLQAAIQVGYPEARRIRPVDGVVLTLLLSVLAAAGPTWSRQPNPLVAQSAPVVVVFKVTASMENTDLAPSRLERGKQKIRDFLDLRAGARSALLAYAGSAHVVVPMTEDASIILPYLEGLSPEIMPKDGASLAPALERAQDLLEGEGGGALLLVADALDPADVATVEDIPIPVSVLSTMPEGTRDRGLDALGGRVIGVRPDDDDILRLDRALNASYRRNLLENSDDPWLDRGPLLAWPVVLLLLLWFRRGWTMQWAAALAVMLVWTPDQSRAEGVADWFWAPDQQGQHAYDRKEYSRAADLFTDPLWRGWPLYRAGRYEESALILERVETAQAAMMQGLANIRNHAYRDGVRSFETALARDPDYPGAAENLETAKRVVAYIEAAQQAQDTRDQTELRPDDVTYDNEENKGQELQVELPQEGADGAGLQSAEQWMNSVDTETGEFLKMRFMLEAAQAPAGEGQGAVNE
ncbi:VWA domain-containing protein [Ruegeria sp. HKCCD8929]|uniref:vWA domain-containing protein n=1 Tax=Ruegeria sp. HKCCD8929 TaxID=2683006 RepID=UPI001488388F|nr:VWA domain-containing protein [Ruegeria sp. HKCCD8929]